MSLAESQEFFALNPDDLSGPAEQDRSGGSFTNFVYKRMGVGKLLIFHCEFLEF